MFYRFISYIRKTKKAYRRRHFHFFENRFCLQNFHKKLSIKKKNNSGKSNNNRIICWTKSSFKKRLRTVRINYVLRNYKLSFISNFKFLPYKNKLISLTYFMDGSATYYNTTEFQTLFAFVFFNRKKKLKRFINSIFWSIVYIIPKLTIISYIEDIPGKGAQYTLSPGTGSKIISIDYFKHNVMILLASKIKRIVSYYSFVFLGKMVNDQNRKYRNTKAGYWRLFGLKSIVRGVAMNPIDHPHGGRTKAIKFQQTPWGKPTKLK